MKKDWETLEIGTTLYTFEMLQPEIAFAVSLRFLEAVGPVIASCVPVLNMDTDEFDMFNISLSDLNLDQIQSAMMSATTQINPAKIKPIFDEIIGSVFVVNKLDQSDKGHRATYNDFNGKIKTLYKVCLHALRFNFADFFADSAQIGQSEQEGLGA